MAASTNADQIVVGNSGTLWVAAVGSTLPTTLAEPNAAFLCAGYITEDGASFNDESTTSEIPAWQSFYPIDVRISSRSSFIELALMEWDSKTVPLAFGGGQVTYPSAGVYRY